MWQALRDGEIKKQPGMSEVEMLKMFLDEIKREQGRKIELNLMDVIKSFRHKITSKDPTIQQNFLKNREKELNSILGSESKQAFPLLKLDLVACAHGRKIKTNQP